jgi:hypothetical protein
MYENVTFLIFPTVDVIENNLSFKYAVFLCLYIQLKKYASITLEFWI